MSIAMMCVVCCRAVGPAHSQARVKATTGLRPRKVWSGPIDTTRFKLGLKIDLLLKIDL
jgi:hypothetical protein